MSGKKILFIDQSGDLGGAEFSLYDIARLWRDRGTVLLFEDGPFRFLLENAEIRVRIVRNGQSIQKVRRNFGLWNALLYIGSLYNLVSAILSEAVSYDVIYANTQKAFVVSALSKIFSRRKLIWHLHDILSPDHFGRSLRKVVVWLANRYADLVIANSQATLDAFFAHGGRCNSIVIPNGIDPKLFECVDSKKAKEHLKNIIGVSDGPIIGVFGRFAPWKGQHIAIEAARKLPGFHFVFVGSPLFGEEAYGKYLQSIAQDESIKERIHFLGFQENIPAFMKAVDIVLHTSIAPEPLGRVIIEGLFAEKPVIATAAGGALEVIDDRMTGFLVPPNDSDAIARVVRSVVSNSNESAEVARRGYQYAIREFPLAKVLDRITEAITGLLEPFPAKILFIDQTAEMGGGELSLLDIAKHHREKSSVLLFMDGPFRKRLEEVGVTVFVEGEAQRVLAASRHQSFLEVISGIPSLVHLAIRVAKRARQFDILYANSQKAFVVAALASIIVRRPLIWHLRDMLTVDHFSPFMRASAVQLANLCARCVIANSKATASAFQQAGGRSKILVVHNGINPAAFVTASISPISMRLRSELGINGAAFIAGIFARIAPWKGQHVAIEAICAIPNLHLILVGGALFGEKNYANELLETAKRLRILDRVHFLGFRDDIPELLSAVDVVLHTSIAPEPFGRTIVEGMLAAKPIIAAEGGGVVEIIDSESTGILVPPNDVAALTNALRYLMNRPDRGAAMAASGQKRAMERFSLDTTLATIDNILFQELN